MSSERERELIACRLACIRNDYGYRCIDECVERINNEFSRKLMKTKWFNTLDEVLQYIKNQSKDLGVVTKAITPNGIFVAREGTIYSAVEASPTTCRRYGLTNRTTLEIENYVINVCTKPLTPREYERIFGDKPELAVSRHPLVMAVASFVWDFIDDYVIDKAIILPYINIGGSTHKETGEAYVNVVRYLTYPARAMNPGDIVNEMLDDSIHEYFHHLDRINTIIEHGFWGPASLEDIIMEIVTGRPVPHGVEKRIVEITDAVKREILLTDFVYTSLLGIRALDIINEVIKEVPQTRELASIIEDMISRRLIDTVQVESEHIDNKIRVYFNLMPLNVDPITGAPNDAMVELIQRHLGQREADDFLDRALRFLRRALVRDVMGAFDEFSELAKISRQALNKEIEDMVRRSETGLKTVTKQTLAGPAKIITFDVDIEKLKRLAKKLVGEVRVELGA